MDGILKKIETSLFNSNEKVHDIDQNLTKPYYSNDYHPL